MIYAYQKLPPSNQFIPVRSGFNALAIYRFDAIKNIQYECKENNDKRVEVECEHVTFHQKMIDNGFNNIFVNPYQTVEYRGIGRIAIIEHALGRLKSMLF
ncbi:MAG: hypothetical protein HRU20_12715 [Pseudomonadales bacterium]|nr:hypothetical protein [Pseudomonadales bacterium]